MKLHVVYDSPNWAYHRIALQIQKYLSNEFEIQLVGYHEIYSCDFTPCQADVVILIPFQAIVMRDRGYFPKEAKLIVCQYDDNVWRSEQDQRQLLQRAMSHADMALFAHTRLRDTIQADLGAPLSALTGLCEDGVDPQFFDYWYHVDWEAEPLKVGWAGNAAKEFHGGDNKGVGVIKEALADLPGIELSILDRNAHWRSMTEMMLWYRDLHLIVCASEKEGTPNPVLEAMSTGRPFVSCLPVGIIPDILERAGKATAGFRSGSRPGIVIGERTPEALRKTIQVLAMDRHLLREMGRAAAQEARSQWAWVDKVEQFRDAVHRVMVPQQIEVKSNPAILPATLPDSPKAKKEREPKIVGVFGASYCGGSLIEYILDSIPGFISVGKPWKLAEDQTKKCFFCGEDCVVFDMSFRLMLQDSPASIYRILKERFEDLYGIVLGGMTPDVCQEIGRPDLAVVAVGHPLVSAQNFKHFDGQDEAAHLETWHTFYQNYLLRYLSENEVPTVIINIENLFRPESLFDRMRVICEAVTGKPFESNERLLWETEWFSSNHHRIDSSIEGEMISEGILDVSNQIPRLPGTSDSQIKNLRVKHLWRYLRAMALNPKAIVIPLFSNVIPDDNMDEESGFLEKPRPKLADQLHTGLVEIVDVGADLTAELTVFVPTVHGPDLQNCLEALKKQDCKFNGPILIENVSPMDAAFQCMNDWCLTPYFVEVDEDMILRPHALRRLHGAAVQAGDRYPIVCFPLHDTLFDRIILGVKIYRHETIRRYPFQSSGSCEMDQAERLAKDGYQILIDWRDPKKKNYDFVDVASRSDKVLGSHGQNWVPQTIYEAVQNRFLKWRRFGYVWLEEYPGRFLEQLIQHPSERALWAFLGMASGLSCDMNHLEGEKDFQKYENIPGWKQFQRFFGERTSTNLGSWGDEVRSETFACGDETTYKKAADFLRDCKTVEDWGCGRGGFRKFLNNGMDYKGVDGSKNPNVDQIADLCGYVGDAEGVLLRHVLEHNYGWRKILENALRSFSKKLCIVLFTPFSDQTRELYYHKELGVPDLSFSKKSLIEFFEDHGCCWELEEGISTDSSYKQEHIFRVGWKS